jgi:hypothetical protein
MYTTQRNAHNDIIVCIGNNVKKGYWIVFTGTFAQCNQLSQGADL